MKVADAATFAKLGNSETLTTIKVKDFNQNYDTIQKIVTLQQHQYPRLWSSNGDQKFEFYAVVNGLYSGLAFMGFFLGIAFLAMLASTLMFKILSGANYDKNRYLTSVDSPGNRRLVPFARSGRHRARVIRITVVQDPVKRAIWSFVSTFRVIHRAVRSVLSGNRLDLPEYCD